MCYLGPSLAGLEFVASGLVSLSPPPLDSCPAVVVGFPPSLVGFDVVALSSQGKLFLLLFIWLSECFLDFLSFEQISHPTQKVFKALVV